MDRKRQKMTPKKDDVQKECQDRKITALERKLEHMENKLKLVTAELEQVKEEQVRDKTDFEAEKSELESKIDKYKEQCTKLQSENEKLHNENIRLQKYLQDLESENINKFPINLKGKKSRNSPKSGKVPSLVNETNHDALNINVLPNEILLKVFSYLNQNQLGQIARVCRKWNVLIKSPLFWRKVDVRILCSSDRKMNAVVKTFINGLPSCVTFIRLNFFKNREDYITVHFGEICVKLQQKCPLLEVLVLVQCKISNILPEAINFCTQFLQGLKKLVFHYCSFASFADYSGRVELENNSKIEVLDLCGCDFSDLSKTHFSRLLNLKELRLRLSKVNATWFVDDNSFFNQLHVLDLGWTHITASTFQAIQRHGHNLKELYLCYFIPLDHDLNFTRSVFPHLKTICLSCSRVTCEGVVSLIQSCPSLENVYVNEDMAKSFATHPFVVANRCKSGIAKAIYYLHNHKLDYSHN